MSAPDFTKYKEWLNASSEFWRVYDGTCVSSRRKKLLEFFVKTPSGWLPVNNKYQASTKDKDLAKLLKTGVLRMIRDGGRKQNPRNRTSGKRQTYLVLA